MTATTPAPLIVLFVVVLAVMMAILVLAVWAEASVEAEWRSARPGPAEICDESMERLRRAFNRCRKQRAKAAEAGKPR